jgi:hypothetical protein
VRRGQEVLDEANAGTFQELAAFVRAQHGSPSKRARGGSSSGGAAVRRTRLIPTALAVAGGVNSTDHARTFPDLVSLLRAQVCEPPSLLCHPTPSQRNPRPLACSRPCSHRTDRLMHATWLVAKSCMHSSLP